MSEMEKSEQKQMMMPIKRTIGIAILDNDMIAVGGISATGDVINPRYCGGAQQFHDVLKLQLQHPFAEAPKLRRTRGPNAPKAPAASATKPATPGTGK